MFHFVIHTARLAFSTLFGVLTFIAVLGLGVMLAFKLEAQGAEPAGDSGPSFQQADCGDPSDNIDISAPRA